MPRARRGLAAIAPFLVALVVYGWVAARTDPLFQGDQPHYALEAWSLVRDGDRDLANDYASPERVARVWSQPTLLPHAYRYTPDGPLVSYHGAGLPLLLTPAAAVSHSTRAMRLEMALIAALGAQLLFGLLAKLAPDRARLRWAVWASVVFGLPVFGYVNQLYPELPAAVLVLAVARLLVNARLTMPAIVVASACAAFLPWLHTRYAVLAIALALAIAFRLVRQRRAEGVPSIARGLIAAGLPFVLSLPLMMIAFSAWYGSASPTAPLHTPATQVAVAPRHGGSGDSAPRVSERAGFAFSGAVSADRVYLGLARSLFSAKSGWLPFAPVYLLGVAGLIALALRGSRWALFGLVAGLAYLVQVASTGTLPGFAPPGRFELVVVPLVAVPLLLACVRTRWVRVAFYPLAAITVFIGLVSILHIDRLTPSRDPAQRALFTGSGVLLAPWPTVARPEPERRIADMPVAQKDMGRDVGQLADDGREAVAPAGRRGLLAGGAAVPLRASSYLVAIPLRRGGSAPPNTPAATLRLRVQGRVVTTRTVSVAEIPPSGAWRGFPIEFSLSDARRVTPEVVTTGAVSLAVGDVLFTDAIDPQTGLGLVGTMYPGVPRVAAWTLVILALAAAMALTTRRRAAIADRR